MVPGGDVGVLLEEGGLAGGGVLPGGDGGVRLEEGGLVVPAQEGHGGKELLLHLHKEGIHKR